MSTQHDLESLEAAMPMWLLEYLLLNQIQPTAPLAKMSFVLMPWNKDPDVEPLPELLNTYVPFHSSLHLVHAQPPTFLVALNPS